MAINLTQPALTMTGAALPNLSTLAWIKSDGTYVLVNEDNPLPMSGTISTTGLATAARQDTGNASLTSIDGKIPASPATAGNQTTQITAEQAILAKLTSDPATQTTVAAILAKIIAAPATSANQVAATKVGSTVVTNITEHRTISTGLTAATTTVASGGLTISMAFSSDFVGSIAMDGGSDQTWVGADGPYNDSPAPSNLLPAYVVKRSAGTYKIVTGTP